MNRIKIGDKVRYLVNNYHLWFKMKAHVFPLNKIIGNSSVFGKEFTVTGKKGLFFLKQYELDGKLWLTKENLILANYDITCPFKTGDYVKFVPQCSESEIKAITGYHKQLDFSSFYKITKIMYNYYIFINLGIDADALKILPARVIEDIKSDPTRRSLPFRWIDFEKVDS